MQTSSSPSTSKASSKGPSGAPSPGDETDNDIFTDPAIARAMVEDPLFRWLNNSWKPVLTVVVAVVLGSYAWSQFKQTEQARFAEYAELYQRGGQQFEEVQEKAKELSQLRASSVVMDEATQKKLSELEQGLAQSRLRLQDTLAALGDTGAPYVNLAQLYRGLSEATAGDNDKAIATLEIGEWKQAAGSGAPDIAAELAALARARVLVDQEETFKQGWSVLKELATSSKFVFAGAMVTLSRVARNDEERAEASEVLRQVREQHPEQAELLEQAVSRL